MRYFPSFFAAKLLLTTGDNGMGYDDPSKTTEILEITMTPLVKPKHCFQYYNFPLSKYSVNSNYPTCKFQILFFSSIDATESTGGLLFNDVPIICGGIAW